MEANDSKYYLNKLVDQYYNTCHNSISKKLINAGCFGLSEKFQTNPKYPKFQVNDGVRITQSKNIFSKSYTENWSRDISIIDCLES